ncbi:MAG: prepilin-type N-terminal cleavage/methylation domain-containing protein [Alteromonadaceae bacterium]|jgi:prepilin-type N-terminal cleavage/methylation domain-containing protein
MTIIIKEGDSIEKLRGFALVELMVSCSVLLILIMIAKSSNSTDNERIISNKLKLF